MNNRLRLGMLQYQVTRIETFSQYADRIDALVAEGARQADLLLMPEYSCMELAGALTEAADAQAELRAVCQQSHAILEMMRSAAARHAVWLQPGTIPFADETGVRNRAPLIASDGRLAFQDKHVMTRFENEVWRVRPGAPPAVFDSPWGRIGIAVCYDSEFPPVVRAQIAAGAWLVLVPTCTDTLHGFNRVRLSARARALENQCFVAVAPTVGDAPWLATLDSNQGHAGLYGPVDRGFAADGIVCEGTLDRPGWLFANLDHSAIRSVREGGAVRNHRDWPADLPECRVVTLELPE